MMSDSSQSVQPRSATYVQENSQQGYVYLVGAGPGDPGLMTLRGRECLARAEIVLYDGLANEQLLELAPQAEHLCVGKHGRLPFWTQADINGRLVELAQQGKQIVRLKGGDPGVFARTAEELDALHTAGIGFEVVPGITAAMAAASYVGIPITHRHHASAVALITGQQQQDGTPQPIDWEALARFPGTLIFYMGVTTAEQWTTNLIAAGKPATTPTAIVRRCSWSDQKVVRCNLGDVIQHLTPDGKMRPPVITIVGDVAALGDQFDWFTTRPLHGCGVLITRAAEQSHELAESLRSLGATVYCQPLLEIIPPSDAQSLAQATHQIKLKQIDGITFSSSNGVEGFFNYLDAAGLDARALAGMRLAAVGPATAASLQLRGVRADVVPDSDFSAVGLLSKLSGSVDQQRWLVLQTNHSAATLHEGLRQQGAEVLTAMAYETRAVSDLLPATRTALEAGRIQLVTLTSSAIARVATELLAEYLPSLQAISLSPAISTELKRLGWPVRAEAGQNTMPALVEAISQSFKVAATPAK
ncbi:uroporphyrinogen-III C-methyltransferase [Aureliella helgolandensis]|uniref:uroporphyrinogen-III C-methyltransferase n=1 Tax=Aureliella helgolandensis TaxID=2527968 RepID=A0A518G7C5_9BACT|nr:uroporphyrinogen-III C-methyltransferase [Aureliella helgolandensis]QDV24487.1 Uroporphyrinogen-III C-methyltransferase [Aureliella helgolandensis]